MVNELLGFQILKNKEANQAKTLVLELEVHEMLKVNQYLQNQ